jgi:hypothetical protein
MRLPFKGLRVTGRVTGTLITIYNKIRAEIDAFHDACRDKRLKRESLRLILLCRMHSNPGARPFVFNNKGQQ